MEIFPNDFKNLKDLLDNNINLIENFFRENTIDDKFIERVTNNSTQNEKGNNSQNIINRIIPVDVINKNNEVVLVFEIPGLDSKEDINIKLLGSTLVVEGDINRNYLLTTKEQTKFERTVGHFSRKVTLPYILDKNRINAKYQKGLLEVRIPILKSNDYKDISVNFYKE
ncbi:MAG: Hsp20/alpha crystallin family protein [Vulcanibacillus sp.]